MYIGFMISKIFLILITNNGLCFKIDQSSKIRNKLFMQLLNFFDFWPES